MTESNKHYRTCHLCEAMCGVAISHNADQILSIKGDKEDRFSRGHICPKAVALKDLHEDPDRLRVPLRRRGDTWEEVSWEEAYAEIEARLGHIRKTHGKNAIGLYVGNPTVHNPGAMLMLAPFISALNTRNRFSATSVDQLPAMLASQQMFGHQALFPVPDLDRTEFLLCIGANPAASNGSLLSAGDVMGRIRAIRARGGRVVVIDPRHTETADHADSHHFIRPGSDVFLLAAMLNVILLEKRTQLGHLEDLVEGLPALRNLVRPFTPGKAAALTGIPASVIEELARDFAATDRAVCYGRIGTCVQEFGSISSWLIHVLNIVTGHMDREGGAMFTLPAVDFIGLGAALSATRGSFGRYHSRVRGLPEFGGEFPAVTLADEILTPGEGQIRALITHAGNPVLSIPNGRRLEEALNELEFMVSIDFYLNETTRFANIILPPSGPLEHGHYDLGLNVVAVRNVAKYSPLLYPISDRQRHDWQILMELIVRLGSKSPVQRLMMRGVQKIVDKLGLEGMLDLLLRTGPYGNRPGWLDKADAMLSEFFVTGRLYQGVKTNFNAQVESRRDLGQLLSATSVFSGMAQGLSLAELRQHPHGVDLGPLRPLLRERLCTPSGTIDLAPVIFAEDMRRAEDKLAAGNGGELLLIGRRDVRSNNSWMHNSRRLVKGKARCTLMIHPMDAASHGIVSGDVVKVSSRVGSISLPAEVSERVMPGVVSIPHGWGHHRPGIRLGVAEAHAGVSLNDILDETLIDKLTGVAVLNGTPIEIARIETEDVPGVKHRRIRRTSV